MKPEHPDIVQAVLSRDEVLDLFRDVEVLCQQVSVQLRGADERSADGDYPVVDLPAARTLLNTATTAALQLRYVYEDRDWIDTLAPATDGRYNLTRMAFDDLPPEEH